MYGLVDAPLAWSICLQQFLINELHGVQSELDENFYMWFDIIGNLIGLASTHVDDLGIAGKTEFLRMAYAALSRKFGTITKQELPFKHCGCKYERLRTGTAPADQGISITQFDFCSKLKLAKIGENRRDTDVLTAEEKTEFRSLLGGVLWLTLTRPDLLCECSLLQGQITTPTIADLKLANETVRRAQKHNHKAALHFAPLRGKLRLVCVSDASHATKKTSYAQEGISILLKEDFKWHANEGEHTFSNDDVGQMTGTAHLLYSGSHRSKRVSSSTSHAESLSAVSGQDITQVMALRLTEALGRRIRGGHTLFSKPTVRLSLKDLTQIQEDGLFVIPVDHESDCHDLYCLVTGAKGTPQDKSQRLYIMRLRQDRLLGRIRYWFFVPTTSMLSDALTKKMLSYQLMHLLTTGQHLVKNESTKQVKFSYLRPRHDFDETALKALRG
jgi:hypothetical protein